jgi:dihydrofolate reductase
MVAVSLNNVIGKREGGLPWDIPEDTAYFKEHTAGGVMIEGTVCYKELGGPLPDRGTVVVSTSARKSFPGASRASSLDVALRIADKLPYDGPVWICGGERIYAEGLSHCSRLYITRIDKVYEGEGMKVFPSDWSKYFTRLVSSRASKNEDINFVFEVWER